MKRFTLYFFCIFLLIAACNTAQKKENNFIEISSLEFKSPVTDLVFLDTLIGDSDLICLGESRHDIREQFQLKLRMVKYLIQEKGFNTFALESSLPYSNRIDQYVREGVGDIDEIMSDMPGWFLWDTEELRDFFVWLKEHNSNSYEKVRFFGFDIVAPQEGLRQISEFLSQANPNYAADIEEIDFGQDLIDDNFWPNTRANYGQISEERRNTLVDNYEGLHQHFLNNSQRYIKASSQEEYDWILSLVYAAHQANQMFTSNDPIEMGLTRDQSMAQIIKDKKTTADKMIVWAHNVHITKAPFVMTQFPDTPIEGMGKILSDVYGDKMISIGASFGEGYFEVDQRAFSAPNGPSIESRFYNEKKDLLFLDLRQMNELNEDDAWAFESQMIRGQEFEMTFVPAHSFDAFFFTRQISKVIYNPSTRDRLQGN